MHTFFIRQRGCLQSVSQVRMVLLPGFLYANQVRLDAGKKKIPDQSMTFGQEHPFLITVFCLMQGPYETDLRFG
jgi:hypothetical protein